jgi:LysR family transcriptional regulator, regulator for metE and metH
MILETRHLRLVAAIAEHGSLTKAGTQLNLTQSALSHQLLDLERRIETPLFHRMGKRMVPTPAGTRLLSTARPMLRNLHRAEEDLRRLASGRSAVLRLSTECYTCYHWLPTVLERFSASFPQVDVQIVADATRYPLRALVEGRIDLGIVHDTDRDERLSYVPLFRDELVVITHPDHPLAQRPFVSAADFAEEHLIVYTIPRSENSVFRHVLIPAGVSPRRVSAMALTEAIIEMVKAGVGISVLARWAVAPHVEAGTLRAVRLMSRGFHRQWSAAMLRQEPTPLYLREFAKLLSAGPTALGPQIRTGRG